MGAPGGGQLQEMGLQVDGIVPPMLPRELGRVTSLRCVEVTVRPHFEGGEDALPCLALLASLAGLTQLEAPQPGLLPPLLAQ